MGMCPFFYSTTESTRFVADPLTTGSKETEVFRISCFRHLEKPIKTKENKVKHFVCCYFVFICFYWFSPVFLDGESKYFKRRDTESFSSF